MRRTFFRIAITAYTTLPFLCTACIIFINKDNLMMQTPDLSAILFQLAMTPVVLRAKKSAQHSAYTRYSSF